MIKIDASGLSCPEPLMRLKAVIDQHNEIELALDSQTAVETCKRFAESKGFDVTVTSADDLFTLLIKKA